MELLEGWSRVVQLLWLFIACVVASCNRPSAVSQTALEVRQTALIRLGRCHLNPGSIGAFESGGDPEFRVFVQGRMAYSSRTKHPHARGPDYVFDDSFELAFRPGDLIQVELVDRDPIQDDVLIEVSSSSARAVDELFAGKLERAGSFIELERVFEPGRYLVRLERTFIGPADFVAVGGHGQPERIELKQLHFLPWWVNFENFGNQLYAKFKASQEEINPRVTVAVNAQPIFDTASSRRPTGCVVDNWGLEFQLDWKPGDEITVAFEDVDPLKNDEIFKAVSSTDKSIKLLSEPVFGGGAGESFVLFTARKLR